jgi:spermidine synthase
MTAVYGEVPIDGFELDQEIVKVGRKYFDMTMSNLKVVIGDGRLNLGASAGRYDIIAVDAYRPPYIPPHMTTREFFALAAARLEDDGVLTINTASVPGDRRLINGLATTIGSVFPSVYVADIPGSLNTMIFATRQSTEAANLAANLSQLSEESGIHPLLLAAMANTVSNLQAGYESTVVFTDDQAPIEWIVNGMLLDFVVGGGLEYLQ